MAWALRAARHPPLVIDLISLASSHIAHRVALPDGREAWTVLGADGGEVEPAAGFLRYLHRIERSPNTVRAYAHDLKLFFEFLAGRGLAWDAVGVADLGGFRGVVAPPGGERGAASGARPARSASTTNRALSAVMGFYEFHARHGVPVAARLVERGRSGRGSYRPFLYGIAKGSSRARAGRLRTVRELPKVLTLAQIAAVIAAQRRSARSVSVRAAGGDGDACLAGVGASPRGHAHVGAAGGAGAAGGQRQRRARARARGGSRSSLMGWCGCTRSIWPRSTG